MFGFKPKLTPGIVPQQEQGLNGLPKMSGRNKLDIMGAMLRDLDWTSGGGHGRSARGRVDSDLQRMAKEGERKKKLEAALKLAKGDPLMMAAARIDPGRVAGRHIDNAMVNPLQARAADRADLLAQNTIDNTQFSQGMATDRFEYGKTRDAVGDERYADEQTYNRGQDGRMWDWREEEAIRNQRNADRSFDVAQTKAAQTDLGKTPIHMTGPSGEPMIGVLSQGKIVPVEVPGQARLVAPGELASVKSQGRARGKAYGDAQAGLPNAIAGAKDTMRTIDTLRNHAGAEDALGRIDSLKPDLFMSDSGVSFRDERDKLQGQVFLQGYQQLKGAGVITDFEGGKAESSLLAAKRARTQKQFNAAMDDFQGIVARGMARQYERAGQDVPPDIQRLAGQYRDMPFTGQPMAGGGNAQDPLGLFNE
jgi:hypothetical protein